MNSKSTNNESPAALLPDNVNNALTNLRMIAAGRDAVTGQILTWSAMSRLAADATHALESTAPAASESRGSVPDPTPPAVASGEPTAEQWKQAVQECPVAVYSLGQPKEWIEHRARELARSAAAKGEG